MALTETAATDVHRQLSFSYFQLAKKVNVVSKRE